MQYRLMVLLVMVALGAARDFSGTPQGPTPVVLPCRTDAVKSTLVGSSWKRLNGSSILYRGGFSSESYCYAGSGQHHTITVYGRAQADVRSDGVKPDCEQISCPLFDAKYTLTRADGSRANPSNTYPVRLMESRRSILCCSVAGDQHTISWFDHDWYIDSRQNNARGGATNDVSCLTLTAARSDHDRQVECLATNSYRKSAKLLFHLQVDYPPSEPSILPSSDVTVVENENLTLTCRAEGRPHPEFAWKGTGILLIAASVTSSAPAPGISTLTLTGVQRQATGEYSCTATNRIGSHTASTFVRVRYLPPKPTVEPADVVAFVGQSVTFSCLGDAGYPPGLVTWKHNNVTMVRRGSIHINTLFVDQLQLPNSGSYACTITNVLGAVESSAARLRVIN